MTTKKPLRFAALIINLLCGIFITASLNAQTIFGAEQIISSNTFGAHSRFMLLI